MDDAAARQEFAADSAAETHAVEEVLWASMFGADTYSSNLFTRATNPAVSGGAVITPATNSTVIGVAESNRSALTSVTIYFMIDTATSNPLVYRLPEAVVNDVSIDFDVDGIATLNWTGFAKEVQDVSGNVFTGISAPSNSATTTDGTNIALGDIFIDTDNAAGRQFNLVASSASTMGVTAAIDEATTSTKNFIRNRLTSVSIEAAESTDKVSTIFPGQYATISAIDVTNEVVTTDGAHGLTTGDQVYIDGCTGNTSLNGTHHFVRVGDETGTYAGTTNATTEFALFGTKAQAENLGNATGLVAIAAGSYNADTGIVANGKYSLTLTGGSFNIANNITYLVPEELGAINKPLEHVTGTRTANGNATCYLTLDDADITSGTSRQFFNDLVSTGAMSKVVNKFKVTMDIGGATAATAASGDPALKIEFPTAHITVPTHQVEDVISLETSFEALPTDFGTADEITALTYFPVSDYS